MNTTALPVSVLAPTAYEILKGLVSYEPDLDSKLSMLTEVGLTTKDPYLFAATELLRHELSEIGSRPQRLHANDEGKDHSQTNRQSSSDADHGIDGLGLRL